MGCVARVWNLRVEVGCDHFDLEQSGIEHPCETDAKISRGADASPRILQNAGMAGGQQDARMDQRSGTNANGTGARHAGARQSDNCPDVE
jgi:hypothetical protein